MRALVVRQWTKFENLAIEDDWHPKRHKDMGPHFEPQWRNSVDQLFHWAADGRVKPEISHVFPFDRCKEAMATVLGRDAIGRVAVVFDEEARRMGF